jgi:hypothetical protein
MQSVEPVVYKRRLQWSENTEMTGSEDIAIYILKYLELAEINSKYFTIFSDNFPG